MKAKDTKAAEEVEFEELKKALVAKATSIPRVIAMAEATYNITIDWAKKCGLIKEEVKKSATALQIEDAFKKCYEDDDSAFNSTQWVFIKRMMESLIGERLCFDKVDSVLPTDYFPYGYIIVMKVNNNAHNYALNKPYVVTSPSKYRATGPSGLEEMTRFDISTEAIGIPSIEDIKSLFAEMYLSSKDAFESMAHRVIG